MSTRLNLEMTVTDAMVAMVGGNPGAIGSLMEMYKIAPLTDPDDAFGAFGVVMMLDELSIYESRIYCLNNDVCNGDASDAIAVLRANQLGFLSSEDLNHAIDNRGDGIDVADLRTQVEKRLPNFKKKRGMMQIVAYDHPLVDVGSVSIGDLMPAYGDIPKAFKNMNARRDSTEGPDKWINFQQRWFYDGLTEETMPVAKPGIDLNIALNHLKAIQGSFAPKHEHKQAGVAYLASLWFV